ncbi:hypothetical protein V2A60_002040 [Cordyceps javanica]|uniref:Aminoglycoside phosphotransferase n=1 Tax=Cordyceps javanica TaxID=43265 RepID=A0A545WDX6_9HYPO|nr:aminoglycoside phosphotransferase [Cordyceps javanica]TQW12183.1 aminoglycoside phosphotransferase [Cordyceps javanica]
MQLDGPQDIVWTASDHERHFQLGANWFVKRQLSAEELPVDRRGRTIWPLWDTERLRNEYSATIFIRQHTNVPVQECQLYTIDGLLHFASRRIHGAVQLEYAPEGTKIAAVAAVEEQMNRFIIPQLRRKRRRYIGSVSRFIPVIPPRRIYQNDSRQWEQLWSENDVFVYCHNDLSRKNIWLHPENFKIMAITGWEHAGFFPHHFELPLWTASGWDERHAMRKSVLARDLSFFELSPSDLKDSTPAACAQ